MACNKYIIKDGKPGKDGLSAYEIAVQNGFIGTEQEWLNSLQGNIGPMGLRGLPGQDGINGLNGQDGQSSFTSYVFTRQEDINQPDVPTGGSFNNPLPNESRWTDGVPFGQGAVYMSYRIFTSDGLAPQQPVWSNPIIAADSALVDFEWSTVPTNPGNPTDNPNNWTNESSQLSIWMAVRTMSNGSWSDWNIIYIKGEKGEDGQAGVSTANIYAVNGSWNTAPALNRTERSPIGWSSDLPVVNLGEYVWTAQALIDPITNELVTDWTAPIRMNGIPGEDGDNGASPAYRGDWSDEVQYQGSNIIIDFVIYDDGVNGRQGYLARTDSGEIPIGTLPTDTDYWNGPIENVDALFTDFLVAYSAYIQNLTVGSLRTGINGERIEIFEGENKLKFYKNEDINSSLEIGTFEIELKTPVPQPDPQPTVTVAGLINNIQNAIVPKTLISDEGVIVNQSNPKLSAFALPVTSGTISTRFVLYAGATFLGPGPAAQQKVAAAFESVYIHAPIRVWGQDIDGNGEMKYGFTGVHNNMEYINGVAIGPV